MNHYVYRLDDPITGEFYYGSRSCKCSILDDKYMGSMITWKPDKTKLIKEIIQSEFDSRDDAIKHERDLIIEFVADDLNRNYHIPGIGFHTTGIHRPVSESTRKKLSDSLMGHKGYWRGKYGQGPLNGKHHTEETKLHLSRMKKGTKHSDVTRKLMSDSAKGYIKSDEHRLNLSKAKTGVKLSSHHIKRLSDSHKIPVIQYDLNGNFIKEWPSALDVLNELKINHISTCCKGKCKTAGGYKWKYKKRNIKWQK